MSKHTPGPWRLINEPNSSNVLVCGSPSHIATVAVGGAIDAPTDHANARLIAAAPELLAALHDLIEAADSMRATFGCIRGDTPEDSDMFIHEEWAEDFLKERADAALAAIAKATGKQA